MLDDPYMLLNLGGVYTRATLRDAIEDWSVDAKFHYKVVATERAKLDYRCANRKSGRSSGPFCSTIARAAGSAPYLVNLSPPALAPVPSSSRMEFPARTQWLSSIRKEYGLTPPAGILSRAPLKRSMA